MVLEVSVESAATCGSSEYISSEARSEAMTRYQLVLMRKRSARLPYLLRPLGQDKVKLAVDRPIQVTPSSPGPFLTTAQREKLYDSINAQQPKKKNPVTRPKKVKSLVKLSPVISGEAVAVLGSLVTLAASPPMAVVQQVLRAVDDAQTSPAMLETLALVVGTRVPDGADVGTHPGVQKVLVEIAHRALKSSLAEVIKIRVFTASEAQLLMDVCLLTDFPARHAQNEQD